MTNCWLCNKALSKAILEEDGSTLLYKCEQCGVYKLHKDISRIQLNPLEKQKIAGWLYEYGSLLDIEIIDKEFVEKINNFSLPSLGERANKILMYVYKRGVELGVNFDIMYSGFIPMTYSKSLKELGVIVSLLVDRGLIEPTNAARTTYVIKPEGYVYLENLQRNNTQSSQAFVAMWFDNVMQSIFDKGFYEGIKKAGYSPFRVDMKEHVNKIDDEIISQIRQSKFLVADFTGQRGGVYFEAGFAMGLGLPVIWTCREDHTKELHFDIRQYNCLIWKTAEELAERLQYRIEAILGKGPNN